MRILLLITVVLCTAFVSGDKDLKYLSKSVTNVQEPSDVCFSKDYSRMFIVSDDGFLYETDLNGKKIKMAPFEGGDFEAVYCDEKFIYAVDERTRRIHFFDINTLEHVRQIDVPNSGGMNEGYESMTYVPSRNTYILVTEKNPIWVYELDSNFRKTNEVRIKIASDISSATFYNDNLYFLSDEDRTVFKVDPKTYTIIKSWKLKVNNPEGITFNKNGELIIVCDDDQLVLTFSPLSN